MKMTKQIKVVFIVGLILLLFRSSLVSAESMDKIVAIVNDTIITQSDVNRVLSAIEAEYAAIYTDSDELNKQLNEVKVNIVSQMVEEKLVLTEAKRYDIEVGEDVIASRIDALKVHYPNEILFEQALSAQSLTLKDLQDRFYNQEIMKRAVDYFIRSKVRVEPLEIQEFYKEHKQELLVPEKARVSSILIRIEEESDERKALKISRRVLERLNKGEDFSNLVKLYSQGTNIEEGGSLGFIERGDLIKEIDEAVFELEVGEFTDAIKTEQGYRIFKMDEKMPTRELDFYEAQDLIKDMLYGEKFTQNFRQWINKLKEDAYIVIK